MDLFYLILGIVLLLWNIAGLLLYDYWVSILCSVLGVALSIWLIYVSAVGLTG